MSDTIGFITAEEADEILGSSLIYSFWAVSDEAKKQKALQSSYDLIFAFINIPDVITEELKRAQAYLAGNLMYTNGKSTSLSGVEKNVNSFSIGDMSYSFNTLASLVGNSAYEVFPEPIYSLLFPYFKSPKIFAPVTTSAR